MARRLRSREDHLETTWHLPRIGFDAIWYASPRRLDRFYNCPQIVKMNEATEKERRIIGAAIETFKRYGVRKTSMGDIAEAVGVSRQTLYATFATKDDLLVATIRYLADKSLLELKARWATVDSVEDKLDVFFDVVAVRLFEQLQATPDARDILTGFNDAGRKVVAEARAAKIAALAEIFAPYRDQIVRSGTTVEAFAEMIADATYAFKYRAEDLERLMRSFKTLKAMALATIH